MGLKAPRAGMSGSVALAASLAVSLPLALTACGVGNQAGQLQMPAVVSGVVTTRPPCVPGRACPFLVALVPDAVVEAMGNDGSHFVHADAHGHFRIALLIGEWTLVAHRTMGSPPGPPVRLHLDAGQTATVNLQVAAG